MSSEQIGHVGYSPDFKSEPAKLDRAIAPYLSIGGSDRPPAMTSAGPTCECGARVTNTGDRCTDCELERLRDLVWRNQDVIDFAGFEDIEVQVNRARDGG